MLKTGIAQIRTAAGFVHKCGLASGSALFLKSTFSSPGQPILAVRIKGFAAPVYLRRGSSDRDVFFQVFVCKQYDLNLPAEKIEFIIDAGANIGLSTLVLASSYPTAQVVALEPDKDNFELLKRNCRAFPNITPVLGGIASSDGHVRITNKDRARDWAYRTELVDTGGQPPLDAVPAFCMDSLMKRHGFPRIDLLKLDVEGAEHDLFGPECMNWLSNTRYLAAELHDFLKPGCSQVFYQAMNQFKFTQSILEEVVVIELQGPAR